MVRGSLEPILGRFGVAPNDVQTGALSPVAQLRTQPVSIRGTGFIPAPTRRMTWSAPPPWHRRCSRESAAVPRSTHGLVGERQTEALTELKADETRPQRVLEGLPIPRSVATESAAVSSVSRWLLPSTAGTIARTRDAGRVSARENPAVNRTHPKEVPPMYARVNTFQGKPEAVDAAVQDVRSNVLPAVQQIPGNAGFISLVDRTTGKAIGITLWETEDAMRQSEEPASGIRKGSADAGGAQVVSVDRYEVTDVVIKGQPARV